MTITSRDGRLRRNIRRPHPDFVTLLNTQTWQWMQRDEGVEHVSVSIDSTVDRSVLGIMVDFAKSVPYHLEPGHWDEKRLRVDTLQECVELKHQSAG